MIRRQRERESDAELRRSYEIYRDALRIVEGEPPQAAKIQYFLSAWREIRRRRKLAGAK
jgi:hypothetical protein